MHRRAVRCKKQVVLWKGFRLRMWDRQRDRGMAPNGNKEYIDEKNQCPDYCGGIAGNLKIRCVKNRCVQEEKNTGCSTDSDCVPEQCCHPTACINKEDKKPCLNVNGQAICSQVCEGPLDCGAGTCVCVNGKCSVESVKAISR